MKKSARIIFIEAALYVIIAAGAPWVELLISDRPLTSRSLIATSVISLIAGAVNLKAFLSQAMSSGKDAPPDKVEIVKSTTVPTEEQPTGTIQPTPEESMERMTAAFGKSVHRL